MHKRFSILYALTAIILCAAMLTMGVVAESTIFSQDPYAPRPGSKKRAEVEPTGELPVIYINTDSGRDVESKYEYIGATMKIVLSDDTANYENLYTEDFSAIEIRGRGNSTWWQNKRPYKLKLGEKANLFGMGSSRHWILLANAMDGTNLRNTMSYNLSGQLGLVYIRNIHVELVFNGEYAGLYQLTENIRLEKGRVPGTNWESVAEDVAEAIGAAEGMKAILIDKLADKMKRDLSWITSGKFENYKIADYFDMSKLDTSGGYLIELDEYYDEVSKFVTDNDVPIMIKSPEYLETNSTMFKYIQSWIQDMEDALYGEGGYNSDDKHYSEYMDVDSFIDYWIVNQAFKSVELLFKSCFMYKEAGGLITFGPVWDMDWSSGNHANLGGSSGTYDEWNHSESQDREYWYRAIYDDPFFIVQLQDRWWKVHDKIEECIASLDDWQAKLQNAADLNNNIWGKIGGWDFDKECSTYKKWLQNRLDWMDEQLSKRDPDIMNMGISPSKKLAMTVAGADGYVLSAGKKPEIGNAADLYYDGSGKLSVSVKVTDDKSTSLDYYVNGIKKGSVKVSSGSASFTVDTADMIKDIYEKRNVIRIIAHGLDGKKTGDNYVSLTFSGKPVYSVMYSSGASDAVGITPRTTAGATDAKITVAQSTLTREGYIFKGWSDGTNTYQPAETLTLSSADILLTAVWEVDPNYKASSGGNAAPIVIAAACVAACGGGGFFVFKHRKTKAEK